MMRRPKLLYVQEYRDQHGKLRRYFRRPGCKKIPLPGLPGSDEFKAAYAAAVNGAPKKRIIRRSEAGTIDAAVASYLQSVAFALLADETRRTRKNILERFRAKHGKRLLADLTSDHIQHLIDGMATTPSSARNFLNTLRALMKHCIVTKDRTTDPTAGVTRAKIKTDGYYTWTEEDIAQFEKRHAVGSRARLALALLLYTAQRRSDVVVMGRQHVQNGFLMVKQSKTGAKLAIAMHPDLTRIIEATPTKHLTFLTTAYGEPFTPAGFTNWFRDRCNEAELPRGVSAHGLRKAACRRLADAGCSEQTIMSISGHSSSRELQIYVRAANQRRLSESAIATMTKAFPAAK